MRILYGITKSNFGGAQRYVYDLAVEAKKRGHEVAVILGGSGELSERLRDSDVRVVGLPTLGRDISLVKDVKEFFSLMKILSQEKPDVFHVNSSKMGGLGALAGRLVGVKKMIFTSHGWAFNESWRPVWQKVLIKIFSWLIVVLSHETICVSEKTRENIFSWPFIKNKLVVIHNGLESFRLKERTVARQELGVTSNETKVVGTLAELHKVKGLDVLLEAWQVLHESFDAQLVIAGRGDEAENLQNTANNLGISGSVKFLGFVPEARSLLSGLDIFILPSRSENLPYAILEAGFAGLPVVASRVGGIPEIINNGENGFLVEKESVSGLVIKLKNLLEDGNLAKRLGNNLKRTITEKFSREKMFEETFASYQA